jgi:hypothetical protein
MIFKNPDNWDKLVDDWISAARTGGTSASTRKKYRGPVAREFIPWLREQGVKDPKQIDSRLLTRYGAYLLDTPNRVSGEERSKATVRSYVTSNNLFVAWLKEAGEIDILVAGRRPPLPPKERKDVLTPPDPSTEVRTLPSSVGPLGYRPVARSRSPSAASYGAERPGRQGVGYPGYQLNVIRNV